MSLLSLPSLGLVFYPVKGGQGAVVFQPLRRQQEDLDVVLLLVAWYVGPPGAFLLRHTCKRRAMFAPMLVDPTDYGYNTWIVYNYNP